MNKIIVFKNEEGKVSFFAPSSKYHSLEDAANTIVPKGQKYLIIKDTDLPDREQRNQWDIDDADLTEVSKGAEWEFGLATENGYAWAKHTNTPDLFRVYVNFKIV